MKKRDAAASRAKILSAAEKIISEAGFDGARMDDIAKEAGVNKALIYYYFQSKDEILQTLFTNLVEDARRLLIETKEGVSGQRNTENYHPLFDRYIRFVSEKRALIKIAVSESIKTSSKVSMVLELGHMIADAEIEQIRQSWEEKGLSFPRDRQALLVMEFFTGLMPFLSYALYKEQWESYYGVSEEQLRLHFAEAFKKTHLAGHLATGGQINEKE